MSSPPTALVTGCTGIVGHGTTLSLLRAGYRVFGTSRRELQSHHPSFTPLTLDLEDSRTIQGFSSRTGSVNLVVHCAARMRSADRADEDSYANFVRANATATLLLLEEYASSPGTHFIFISGTALVDHSQGPATEESPYVFDDDYIASKIIGEIHTRRFGESDGATTTILRIRAPYGHTGRNLGVIPTFLSRARAGQDLTIWGAGLRKQAFLFSEDIGDVCVRIARNNFLGTYHLVGEEVTTMRDLADAVLSAFDHTTSNIQSITRTDPGEGRFTGSSMEKLQRKLVLPEFTPLAEGLRRIVHPNEDVLFFSTREST